MKRTNRPRDLLYWSRRLIWYMWPWTLLGRFTAPVPPGLWLINVCVQRILRVNGRMPFMVHFTSTVTGKVSIENNVWKSIAISGGCYIQGGQGIYIGADTLIAPGVKIISANHDPHDLATWIAAKPIRIGRRCWIGANAVILPNVQLGDNVIVGAGAVVTKSFGAGCTIAGVPARIIKDSRPQLA